MAGAAADSRWWQGDAGYDADLDPEELAFQRLHGPWQALHPTQVAAYLGDVAGGWAVEAFAGVSRAHDDIDVSILRRDLPDLCRAQALLFTARLHRPRDDADLGAAWPLLDARQPAWLLQALAAVEPDHPWRARLAGGTRGGGGPTAPHA